MKTRRLAIATVAALVALGMPGGIHVAFAAGPAGSPLVTTLGGAQSAPITAETLQRVESILDPQQLAALQQLQAEQAAPGTNDADAAKRDATEDS